ncbi:hypothetical protein D3C84_320280 [compost metagenome]
MPRTLQTKPGSALHHEITLGRMAKLYGLHRSTLYEAVSKSLVSAGFDGKGLRVIDRAEMIRRYGDQRTPQ